MNSIDKNKNEVVVRFFTTSVYETKAVTGIEN